MKLIIALYKWIFSGSSALHQKEKSTCLKSNTYFITTSGFFRWPKNCKTFFLLLFCHWHFLTRINRFAMAIVESYSVAIMLCFITMICWGSWANTMKLTARQWVFQLYYWDYAAGVILFALLLAFTAGSLGEHGRPFIQDIGQARFASIGKAFLAGVIFNLSNVLVVTEQLRQGSH